MGTSKKEDETTISEQDPSVKKDDVCTNGEATGIAKQTEMTIQRQKQKQLNDVHREGLAIKGLDTYRSP